MADLAGLTVLIPAKDEAHNIPACLASAQLVADEILLADSGSTDETMAIAQRAGARIIEREYVNSADMKNWAIPKARHEWVFVLDADERITPELATSIRAVMAAAGTAADDAAAKDGDGVDAYRVQRRSFVFGHPIRYCGWQNDVLVRLFRRDRCRYDTRRVHAKLDVPSGRIGRLRGDLLHHTYRDFTSYLKKLDRYTTWSAEDLMERGRRATFGRVLCKPPLRFLKQYVLRQGFRDGLPGLILCGLSATSVFVRYAKLWLMQNRGEQGR